MVFSSLIFMWIFFPIVFLLGRLIQKPKHQNILLLIASLFFYAWGEPAYFLLLLVSIALNYLIGFAMGSRPSTACTQDRTASVSTSIGSSISKDAVSNIDTRRKLFLILGIICDLGILGYFKYSNFFLNTIDHLIPGISLPRTDIALPLGISFFTFQELSYLIDLYRGRFPVQKDLFDFALYVSFFPKLIQGPIVMYRDFEKELRVRTQTSEKTAEGIRRFIFGLGKKVLIADVLGISADKLFALDPSGMTPLAAWCAAFFYTMQIYYDFSGYSDMAVGIGKMFGFTITENFDYPYLSSSIREFWRRWHITLGAWFRDFLYIPLGGNRKGRVRTYINLLIVFAATGLWHGASWNFVGWGLYHGFFIVIERMGFDKFLKKHKVFSHIYAFFIVMIGWVFFRAGSISSAIGIVKKMFGLGGAAVISSMEMGKMINARTMITAAVATLGCGIMQALFTKTKLADRSERFRMSVPEAVFCCCVLVLSIAALAGSTSNSFIYFKF